MKLRLPLLFLSSAMLATATAQAGDLPVTNNNASGYVWDSYGHIVRDGNGNCVRNIYWKKDIPECGGKPEAEEVVVVPEAVTEVVEVEEVVVIQVAKPAKFDEFFKTNSAELSDKAKSDLNDYVEYLNANPEMKLNVRGFTDNTGAAAYNKKLSQKRADSVKTYLESKGIATDRISAIGMGEDFPNADNATVEGRSQNRRVELTVAR